LLSYHQNSCPKFTQWLRRDAGCINHASISYHLGEGAERVYGPPRIYDFSFFPVNRTFETVLLLQKQYVSQTWITEVTETPNNLLK